MLITGVRVYGVAAKAVGRVLMFQRRRFSVVTVAIVLLLKRSSSRTRILIE
jgi:hypothetical protein